MKKQLMLIAIVMLQAVAIGAFAQTNTRTEKPALQNTKKELNAHLVYYHYKDIKDISLAKAAWVKDHPNEYKEMKNSSYKSTSAGSSANNKKPLPNADRRMPKDYDDSKTNSTSK